MAKQCKYHGCTMPVFSHDYCVMHQPYRTDKKWEGIVEKKKQSYIKRVQLKKKPKQSTGQKEVFEQVLIRDGDKSFISGYAINEIRAGNFIHILAKGQNKYPAYKNYIENIKIGTEREHSLYDHGTEMSRLQYAIDVLKGDGYKVNWKELYELAGFLKIIYPEMPGEEEFNEMFNEWKLKAKKPA